VTGRWGSRPAEDDLESRIQSAVRLYERPGTPGERDAAAEALRRMGVDPDKLDPRKFMRGLRS
jgi:hypothetical protein